MQETTTSTNPVPEVAKRARRQSKLQAGLFLDVALAIADHALRHPTKEFYADEIEISKCLEDHEKNVTGMVFRFLAGRTIITKGTTFRASKSKQAHGRAVFAYYLASAAKAEAFLSEYIPNYTPSVVEQPTPFDSSAPAVPVCGTSGVPSAEQPAAETPAPFSYAAQVQQGVINP